jgi:methylthioribulose-1-phosphate dehydratase
MADRFNFAELRQAARELAATGRRIHQQGWSPATSSNYSRRLDANHCAITVSGRDKAHLEESDIMAVNLDGQPVTDGRPSAETALHTGIYQRFANIGAVLHTHSHASTVLTMHGLQDELVLEGYELLKALEGIDTHETRLRLPVLENSQDIGSLAARVERLIDRGEITHGYLIRGHGLYTWAGDLVSCFRHLEALEFLLSVTLERYRLS